MMIKPTIALQPTPATPRWVFGTRVSETLFVAPMSAETRPFHPAFGNGDTPHYGL